MLVDSDSANIFFACARTSDNAFIDSSVALPSFFALSRASSALVISDSSEVLSACFTIVYVVSIPPSAISFSLVAASYVLTVRVVSVISITE